MKWPWASAIQSLRDALAVIRASQAQQTFRLTNLEHMIMTQQTSLDALTAKVTALGGIVATVTTDINSAVAELQGLKDQVTALQNGTFAVDDSAALDQLAASVDSVITGLQGSATAVEAAVAAAKA